MTNDDEQRRLIATVRAIMQGTFLVWVVCTVAVLALTRPLSHLFKVNNPWALYFTVALALTGLWIPVAKGVLQGQHCPAVLIEGAYLSNPREADLIENGNYRQKLAEAVASAVDRMRQTKRSNSPAALVSAHRKAV